MKACGIYFLLVFTVKLARFVSVLLKLWSVHSAVFLST